MDYCDNTTLEKFITHTSDSIESVVDLYKIFVPILLVGCMLSLILNTVLVAVGTITQSNLSKSNRSRSPILLLSLNLAATDGMASLLMGIGLLVNSFLPVVFGIEIGWCLQLVLEIFRLSSLIASALHLLALALVHYKGIVNPLHYRSVIFCSQHRTRSIYLMSFICWFLPSVVIALYFGSIPCQGFQIGSCRSDFILMFRFRVLVVISFFIPLIIMFYLYIRIFIIIKRHQQQRAMNQNKSSNKTRKIILNNNNKINSNNNDNNDLTCECNDDDGQKKSNNKTMVKETKIISSSFKRCHRPISPTTTIVIVGEDNVDGNDNDHSTSLNNALMVTTATATAAVTSNLSHRHRNNLPRIIETTILCRKNSITKTESLMHRLDTNNNNNNNNNKIFSLFKRINFFNKKNKPKQCSTDVNDQSYIIQQPNNNGQSDLMKYETRSSTLSSDFQSKNKTKSEMVMIVDEDDKNDNNTTSLRSSVYRYILRRKMNQHQFQQGPQCSTGHAKALITTLLILGTYIVCWIPAVLYFALTCIDNCYFPIMTINYRLRVIFSFITNGLVILKAIIDPFIYTYRMKEMKTTLNRYLYCICPFDCVKKRMDLQQDSTWSGTLETTVHTSTRKKKQQQQQQQTQSLSTQQRRAAII